MNLKRFLQSGTKLADIAERIAPISPSLTNAIVYERFRDETDIMVLAVVDQDQHIVGIIERQSFNLKMADIYGRDLYSKRSVTLLMDTEPLIVDENMPIHAFTQTSLTKSSSQLLRGFIVTSNAKYSGVGTTLSIMTAISDELQKSLNQQRDMMDDLILLSHESHRQQNFLNSIIDHIPAMVMVKTVNDECISLINQVGESFFGRPKEDIIGKQSTDIFDAKQAIEFDDLDAHCIENDMPVLVNEAIISNGDEKRIVQLKKTVLKDLKGNVESILTLGIDLTEQKEAEAKINKLAHYDPLTGLSNRAYFAAEMDRFLGRVLRNHHKIALLCLDLDRFKAVNDSYGHHTGDQLLCQVADRLKSCLRKGDFLARMGGDEFAIVQNISKPEDAQILAERLIEAIGQPFFINNARLDIGVSIGISLAPNDGLDAHNLLSRADLALYRVKQDGRNGWCFFRLEMDEVLQKRLETESDLKISLNENHFELYFQPLMNLSDDRIVSFEALLRWNHPKRGLVSPAEFIPLAEEYGLIGPMGEWVLNKACHEAARWPKPWRVAVNISPIQFRFGSLLNLIKKALKTSGLSPDRLELEITESVLLSDEKRNIKILSLIRDMGVRIAMDDFGTGYSSLSYLRAFPFDKIKIDQSFVRDLPRDAHAMTIIQAITEMARSLNVHITAEGVETLDQLTILRSLNCKEVQGYYIGRPSPSVLHYSDYNLSEETTREPVYYEKAS